MVIETNGVPRSATMATVYNGASARDITERKKLRWRPQEESRRPAQQSRGDGQITGPGGRETRPWPPPATRPGSTTWPARIARELACRRNRSRGCISPPCCTTTARSPRPRSTWPNRRSSPAGTSHHQVPHRGRLRDPQEHPLPAGGGNRSTAPRAPGRHRHPASTDEEILLEAKTSPWPTWSRP